MVLLRLVFTIIVVLGGGMAGCRVEFATTPLSTTLSLANKVNPTQLIKNRRIDRDRFVQLIATGAFNINHAPDMQKIKAALDQVASLSFNIDKLVQLIATGAFNSNDTLDMQKIKAVLDQAASFPLHGEIKRTFMWEVTAPNGKKHWIFAEKHVEYPLSQLPATSQLFIAIEQATVFMPESTIEAALDFWQTDFDDPRIQELNKMISGQITVRGKQRAAKIIELDDVSDANKLKDEKRKASQSTRNLISEVELALYFKASDLLLQQNYAYMEGDLTTLTEISEQVNVFGNDIILVRRNIAWVKKIIAQCQQGESCLIYPGVGHLFDNNTSLVALLRKEGYIVRRVD